MKWTDIESIAISLKKIIQSRIYFYTRFTDLRLMILKLPGFNDSDHGCNEKILESIQLAWDEERNR